jgi:hypothetical protein
VFETVLANQQTGAMTVEGLLNGLSPGIADTAVFSSTVLAMPLRLADLKLPAGQAQITYRVQSYASVSSSTDLQRIDDTGELQYDLTVSHTNLVEGFQGLPFVNDVPGTVLTLRGLPHDLLILHHHNLPGQQIQILRASAVHYLPLIVH